MEGTTMDEKFTFSEKQLSRLRMEYSQLDDNEFETFVEQAERLELDPFCRQIYAVKKEGSRMQVLCTIDGLRIVAERSSKYAGQTPAMWCGNDGGWKDVWLEKTPPAACKVGVMRSDFAQPLFAVARYDSYNQGTTYWTSMPDIMIAKCAEALALRRAFPARLSGCYSDAEINTDRQVRTETVQKPVEEKASLAEFIADPEALKRIDLAEALKERDSEGELYTDKSTETLLKIRKRLNRLLKEEQMPEDKAAVLQRKIDAINAILYDKQMAGAEETK